jgi:hypothetical protein
VRDRQGTTLLFTITKPPDRLGAKLELAQLPAISPLVAAIPFSLV